MDLSGAAFVATVQKSGDNLTLVLRDNQQITAQILKLVGQKAVLSVRGMRIVARLSSPEQGELLQNQRLVRFLVRNVSKEAVELQLLPQMAGKGTTGAQGVPAATAANAGNQLATVLLQNLGIRPSAENLQLASALLNRGMNVTPEQLQSLKSEMARLGKWGDAELNTAVRLKQAGLPITPGTIALFSEKQQQALSKVIIQLHGQLRNMLEGQQQIPPKAAELAQRALNQLDKYFIQWSGSATQLKESLQTAVQIFGRSLERDLAEIIQSGALKLPQGAAQTLMLTLAGLRGEVAQMGSTALLEVIDQFMEQVRSLQLMNLPSQTEPAEGQWVKLDLPLRLLAQQQTEDKHSARLRVAYRKKGEGLEVDPDYTRLIIQVDITSDEALDIDLSIASKKIGAQITATNEDLRELAEDEFPSLSDALESAGYEVLTSKFKVDSSPKMKTGEDSSDLVMPYLETGLDMEV